MGGPEVLSSAHALCVYKMDQGDLAVYAAELPPDRVLRLFYLGMGLAKLLQVSLLVILPASNRRFPELNRIIVYK